MRGTGATLVAGALLALFWWWVVSAVNQVVGALQDIAATLRRIESGRTITPQSPASR